MFASLYVMTVPQTIAECVAISRRDLAVTLGAALEKAPQTFPFHKRSVNEGEIRGEGVSPVS